MDVENKYGTLQIQRELLILLREFDLFCQSNSINYSVCSGTLLGAVRHQGFIPWDDDLDCIVDRKSFNQITSKIDQYPSLCIECASNQSLWINRVRLTESHSSSSYIPTLDLFVLDNCPDNHIRAKLKLFAIKTLQGMMKSKINIDSVSILYKICSIVTFVLGRFFTIKQKYSWYIRISKLGNEKPSKYLKIYNDQYCGLKVLYPAEIMSGTIRMPFENITINGLSNYDEYLRLIYGDNYMIPPKDLYRIPHHL